MIVFHPKGSKFCSTRTPQCHHLRLGMWDNLVNDIRTWEGKLPPWKLVQTWFVDVDIDLSSFQMFLETACKYVLNLLSCYLHILLYEHLCVCIDWKVRWHPFKYISSASLYSILSSNSLVNHASYIVEKLLNNCCTWRYRGHSWDENFRLKLKSISRTDHATNWAIVGLDFATLIFRGERLPTWSTYYRVTATNERLW